MSNEAILERARNYLCSGWSGSRATGGSSAKISPEVVYEHSVRVLELSKLLARDPSLSENQVDGDVLSASALFHDAGWIDLVRKGQLHPSEIFSRPADTELYQRGAQVACEQIGKLVAARTLKKIVTVITELKNTRPSLSDSILIGDADNLEDFGLLGFTFQVRAAHATGKSTRQLIEGWHRQQEYHYWEARVKKALRLETSKSIARRRLDSMGMIFDLLCQEIDLEDVKDFFSNAPVNDPRTIVIS
ncbi:MAG: HD domain-containing protein [Phycisphaerae bacterium]